MNKLLYGQISLSNNRLLSYISTICSIS
ncbi:hypothetical protein MED222_06520 [Vibrio sp. MED222]|nr:hypothetical protein MED222_06520 [Vibrio sp. MED222]